MNIRFVTFGILGLFVAALIAVVAWPHLDIIATGWFYVPGKGFPLEDNHAFGFLHHCAIRGAWALGFLFAALIPIAFFLRNGVAGIGPKGWIFLLLALLLGPVLIANGALKDHWGRARPREVAEFGGHAQFSPALQPRPDATRNGSFVSGDGAFGFFLPSFAYLVPLGTQRKRSQQVFWGCVAVGSVFAFTRLAAGAHFLSDNLFAASLMLMLSAGLHMIMFGRKTTLSYWRLWLLSKN